MLTFIPEEASKAEENVNAHEENGKEDQKPNAFDKVQADENDEGKTGAKVMMHDLDLYRYELLTRQEPDRDE